MWTRPQWLQSVPKLARPITQTIQPPPATLISGTPIRYTAINREGQVITAGAQISRQQFLKQYKFHTRDLRHLDGKSFVPRILVQKGQILVNMVDLRVLINKDKVLIFESKDKSVGERLSMLTYDFQSKLERPIDGSGGPEMALPYEQVVLETVLIHAIAYLEIELTKSVTAIDGILESLEKEVDRRVLRDLLVGSQILSKFSQKAMAVRKALEDAMDDEDYMDRMYLSNPIRENQADIELLLETYYRQADELVQQANKTVKDVTTTEEIVAMIVDSNRNTLMLYRLHISIAAVAIALSLYVADLYGMNLENFIEETDWGMPTVVAFVLLVNVLGTIYNFKKLRHTKEMSMSGVMTSQLATSKELMHRWLRSRSL